MSREALEPCRATLVDRHPHTLTSTNDYARLLQGQGKLEEAAPLPREALETCRATLGDRLPHTTCRTSMVAVYSSAATSEALGWRLRSADLPAIFDQLAGLPLRLLTQRLVKKNDSG